MGAYILRFLVLLFFSTGVHSLQASHVLNGCYRWAASSTLLSLFACFLTYGADAIRLPLSNRKSTASMQLRLALNRGSLCLSLWSIRIEVQPCHTQLAIMALSLFNWRANWVSGTLPSSWIGAGYRRTQRPLWLLEEGSTEMIETALPNTGGAAGWSRLSEFCWRVSSFPQLYSRESLGPKRDGSGAHCLLYLSVNETKEVPSLKKFAFFLKGIWGWGWRAPVYTFSIFLRSKFVLRVITYSQKLHLAHQLCCFKLANM